MVDDHAGDLTLQEVAAVQTLAGLARLLRQLRRREARLRGDSEWTYRELAAKSGWSLGSISGYFDGKALAPTDRFDALVRLLGVTAAEQGALATARDRVEERRREASTKVSRTVRSVPRQLPANVFAFTGRQRQLTELESLRAGAGGPTAAVISAVSGTAGVGKTALALYWAHQVADDFPDGQLYVNLRGFGPIDQVMDPADAIRRFLDALGVPAERIPTDPDARATLYRSELAGRRMLLLFDNARDTAQVRPLLPGTPGCLVLVTSRNQLTGLVAADGAHPIALGLMSEAEARQLLARRLGADRLAAEPDAAAEIVARCAGLPLALSIVAARAATQPELSLRTLVRDLRRNGDRLDTLTTDDPATDVRAVFSWSYQVLTSAAAQLFRLLGLHPGPDISETAAASMAGCTLPDLRLPLAELVEANLAAEHTPGRYSCHDLLRVYAAELAQHVEPEDQRQAATRRMLDHYLYAAHTAAMSINSAREPIVLGPPAPGTTPDEPRANERTALDWFTRERAVLVAATAHATAIGLDTYAWQLAWTMTDFLDRQGHWHELAALQQAAVAAAHRSADPPTQARGHRLLARTYSRLGRLDDARSQLQRALDLCRRSDDVAGQAHIHLGLGDVWERQGRYTEALGHDRQALDLYRKAGHRHGQALALNAVGMGYVALGDHQQAVVCCEQALAILQELDDRLGQAGTWDSLGHAHHKLGNFTRAIDCYQHALDLLRELDDRYSESALLIHLGDTHDVTGDSAAARNAWQQALAILDQLDHPDADQIRIKLAAYEGAHA